MYSPNSTSDALPEPWLLSSSTEEHKTLLKTTTFAVLDEKTCHCNWPEHNENSRAKLDLCSVQGSRDPLEELRFLLLDFVQCSRFVFISLHQEEREAEPHQVKG